jgi:hypothetical protein
MKKIKLIFDCEKERKLMTYDLWFLDEHIEHRCNERDLFKESIEYNIDRIILKLK